MQYVESKVKHKINYIMEYVMKTFIATYSINDCGMDVDVYTVVANTENEALGFVLDSEETSRAVDWEIKEIDTITIGASHICSHTSY
jgi:hypothetical protein